MDADRLTPEQITALRAMTGQQRLRVAGDLWRTAWAMVECSERQRDPSASEDEIRGRVAARMSRGG